MISKGQSPLDNVLMSLNCARSMVKGINQQELSTTETICFEFQNSMTFHLNDDKTYCQKRMVSLDSLVFECSKA